MNEFDIKAQNWDSNPQNIIRAKTIAELIVKEIPEISSKTAFEYGCGTGLLGLRLQSYVKHITMADTSDGMLNILNEKIKLQGIKNITAINYDLETAEILNQKFDIVYTSMTMHHIKDVSGMLNKFYNLLNDNGVLFIADLYPEDGSFHDSPFEGHLGFEPKFLENLLVENNFKNIKYSKCCVVNKTNNLRENMDYPVFLMSAKK